MTVSQLYDKSIKPLPAPDRLRLAALILNDIPPQSLVDYSEEWSEQDYDDFNAANWRHIEAACPIEIGLAFKVASPVPSR